VRPAISSLIFLSVHPLLVGLSLILIEKHGLVEVGAGRWGDQEPCPVYIIIANRQITELSPSSFRQKNALFASSLQQRRQPSFLPTFPPAQSFQCWYFITIYYLWGLGDSRNRVVVPVRQATQAGGINTLESIPGLLTSLKIPLQDRIAGSVLLGRNPFCLQ
jgi:hypothetical protein